MQITIEKIVYPGKSMARVNEKVIFTDEGLPGETVEVYIVKNKKNYTQAKTSRVLEASSCRVSPKCSHYAACSSYQYIDYPFQLEIKQAQVKEMFLRGLGINLEGDIIKPSSLIWGYRNSAKLSVLWEKHTPKLAYHKPGSFDKFIEVEKCFLLSDKINLKLAETLKTLKDKKLYDINEISVRENSCENIDDKNFLMDAESFFQVNTPMLKEVIKDMKSCLKDTDIKTIADLYCGIGTFGIILSGLAENVLGVESSADNIGYLKKNIDGNNIKNYRLYEGDCEYLAEKIFSQNIDVFILDPPRKGLGDKICRMLIERPASVIIYLSCDPATLTRDLKKLLTRYKLEKAQCYDFFPHTPHIETMCALKAVS